MTLKEFAARGGHARAEKLSKEQQAAIGRKAARARWDKTPRKPKAKTS